MKHFKFIALFLFFSNLIFSQEKISLDVSQAIETGLQNSKLLHSSLMKVKAAESKVKEAIALRLPSVKLNARYTRLSKVDPFIISTPFGSFPIAPGIYNNYALQLSLAQPLFTGFRLSSNLDLNEKLNDAVNEEYIKDMNELIFNIKNSYWNAFKAMQFKKVLDETLLQVESHLQDAKNLEKVGMMTRNDILKLEVQLSNVLYQRAEAENAVHLAMISLNNILGINLNIEVELTEKLSYSDWKDEKLDNLISKALQDRAELKAAKARIDASKAGVTLAQANWYPQINLYGNYYYSRPNQRILPSRDKFDGTWDAGVALSMNLWDWLTTKHQTDQAEAQLSQARDAFDLIRDGIALDVTANYLNLSQAKNKIDISKLSVEQTEENNKITSAKFKLGLVSSSDVIDAETALITAKTNYTNSIVDFELAKAKLEKSIGK